MQNLNKNNTNSNFSLRFGTYKEFPLIDEPLLYFRTVHFGTELCRVDGKICEVERYRPLIVNVGEPCEILTPPEDSVITHVVSWSRKALEQILFYHSVPLEKSLDVDWKNYRCDFTFKNRLESGYEEIEYIIKLMGKEIFKQQLCNREYLEELVWFLLKVLFITQNGLSGEIGDIRSVRAPCRAEIVRRLLMAKDFIDSCYGSRISVNDAAGVARFSRYHFMRLFKDVFNISPRQYIINKRLEHAGRLLLNTGKDISEIVLEIGMENQGHFTRMFRRLFSVTPGEFRKMGRGMGWNEKFQTDSVSV